MRAQVPLTATRVHVGLEYANKREWGRVVSRLWLATTPARYPVTGRLAARAIPVDCSCLVVCSLAALANWVGPDRQKAACGETFIDHDGTHWYCELHMPPPPLFRGRPFWKFSDPLGHFGGRSMADAIRQGLVQRHHYTVNGDEFSEAGAFATRTGDDQAGFLRLAGACAAFVCRSGAGDGRYHVQVCDSAEGRRAVSIDFFSRSL